MGQPSAALRSRSAELQGLSTDAISDVKSLRRLFALPRGQSAQSGYYNSEGELDYRVFAQAGANVLIDFAICSTRFSSRLPNIQLTNDPFSRVHTNTSYMVLPPSNFCKSARTNS